MLEKRTIIFGLLILGICGLFDTIILLFFRVGINFGILFPGLLGSILVAISVSYLYLGFDILRLKNRLIRSIIIIFFIISFGSFAVIEILIVNAQLTSPQHKTDYLLVLGAWLEGEEMTTNLANRMNKALEHLIQNPNLKVIVSGGRVSGEDITEAEAMRRFLIANGIKDSRIIKEEKSTNTLENLKFSKEIYFKVTGLDLEEINVITNNFHIFRVKVLAKRIGLTVYVIPSKSSYLVKINNYIREYFAVLALLSKC